MTTYPAAQTGAQREKLDVLPYDLVPFQEMTEAYVRVAEFGAKKYEPWNWSKGLARVQLIGSLLRHTFAYLRGQDRDKDSGLLHTDHILWNAAALCHNVYHQLEDGRRKEPARSYQGTLQTFDGPVVVTEQHEFLTMEPVGQHAVLTRSDLITKRSIFDGEQYD